MRLSHLIDVGLVLTTLSLGTYLFLTSGAPTQSEMDARENNLLSAFSPSEIETIRIKKGGAHASLVLRLDSDSPDQPSYFLGPKGSRHADEAAVAELISALDFATWTRKLGAQSLPETDKFGLREPELEVEITAGPRSYRLLMGKEAPSPKGGRYVLVEGNNVDTVLGVVKGELLDSLGRGEHEFRGTQLFPYSRRETTRLTLKRGEQSLSLRADPLGFLLEPLPGSPDGLLRADRNLTDLIFFQLARAKFETYVPLAEVTDKDLPSPVEVIQQSADGPTYQVRLGGACSKDGLLTYALREKPDQAAGCAERSILSAFELDRDRLIARAAVPLNPDEIDHVTIEGDGGKLDLIRRDAEYLLLSRNSEPVEKASGDEFLETLARGRLSLVPPPDTKNLGKSRITVRGQSPLTAASIGRASRGSTRNAPNSGTDGIRQIDLDIYAAPNHGDLFVHRQDDGAWLSVPVDERWAFLPDDAWAKSRSLSTISSSEIQRVRVDLSDGAGTEIARAEGGFRFTVSGEATDVSLTRDLLVELSELKAVRFVSPSVAEPEKAPVTVTFWRKGAGDEKEREETISVGERVQGGYLAWSSLTDGTFVLPTHARLVFETPLVDRAPARIEPDELDAIEIRVDERVYPFERQAGVLRARGGLASDSLVEPLTDALRSINIVAAFDTLPQDLRAARSDVEVTLDLTPTQADARARQVLEIGPATVFQGQSVRLAWFSGKSRTFLVSAASLSDLINLL